MIVDFFKKAKEISFNIIGTSLTAKNVQDAISQLSTRVDKKVNKNIYSFYPNDLPFDAYDIGDGQSLEMVVNTAKVYLLTIYNSYNVGGVYVVQAGTNRGSAAVTQIAGDTSNFTVTPVSLNSFTVVARNATGRICIMCIGGANK